MAEAGQEKETGAPYCAPPDPALRAPAQPMGALSCDTHAHICGPAARFPFSPTRSYTPPDSGVDDFFALQERLGLSRAVLVQASCHGTDNRAMVDALHRAEGRFAGVAMIDESFTDDELAELHAAGVRGTRFNFVAHLGGAPDLDKGGEPLALFRFRF